MAIAGKQASGPLAPPCAFSDEAQFRNLVKKSPQKLQLESFPVLGLGDGGTAGTVFFHPGVVEATEHTVTVEGKLARNLEACRVIGWNELMAEIFLTEN